MTQCLDMPQEDFFVELDDKGGRSHDSVKIVEIMVPHHLFERENTKSIESFCVCP
jgi:hypothetical protein